MTRARSLIWSNIFGSSCANCDFLGMGISFPFGFLLGAAGLSLLLFSLLNSQESSQVTLFWTNPTRFSSLKDGRDFVGGHETEKRIAQEYMTSLKSLSLHERELSLQVLPHS